MGRYADAPDALRAYQKAAELYPDFALGRRKLAGALRDSDPLLAATHYREALLQNPELEYGEQGWAARRGAIEVDVYRGFRIFVNSDGRRHVAFPILLGVDNRTIQRREWSFWGRFLGLALLRLHKDEILKRFRRPSRTSSSGVEQIEATASPASGPIRAAKSRISGWLMKLLWYGENRFRYWISRHLRYVRFGLAGRDLQDVKGQIDWIYDQWMFDGQLDRASHATQSTR